MSHSEQHQNCYRAAQGAKKAAHDANIGAHNLTHGETMAAQVAELIASDGARISPEDMRKVTEHLARAQDGAARGRILAQGVRSDSAAALAVAIDAIDRADRIAAGAGPHGTKGQ